MKSAPLGLVLVRNTVTHDARVLREAATLRELGFAVLVAGVVSTSERAIELELEGTRIVRLAPAMAIRGVVRRLKRRAVDPAHANSREPAGERSPEAAAVSARGPRPRRIRALGVRLAVTGAYYLQGMALVRRASPALVHANDYNTMWIGVAAKLLCGSRLVYDCHELWPDRNGRPEWRPWLLGCEALFVRLADATITTSPGYAAAIAKRYRVAQPVVVRNIPRWRPAWAALDRPRRHERALAVYLGGLMPGRGLEQAIGALALAPELRLRMIGPGRDSYRAALSRCAERAGVADRVELAAPVSSAAVVESISNADLGLMLIQPVCRSYELTLPNKLFEYAAAGLPILASDLPVIGPLVRDEGIGEVVPASNIELIAQGLRRLSEPGRRCELRARVRSFAERETWEREQKILEAIYSQLLRATA